VKPLDCLLPYQREFFDNVLENKFSFALFSRQVGKSFTCAFLANYLAITRPGSNFICCSSGERQSVEWLKKAIKIATFLQECTKGTALAFSFRFNAETITFSNGSSIRAVPANPDTLRGFSGSILLDEFSVHDHQEEVYAAALPIVSSKFGDSDKKLIICGTPIGKSNLFWRIWEDPTNGFYKQKTDIYAAKAQGLNVDIDQLRRGCIDDAIFEQEFLLNPLDGQSQLFSYELLSKAQWTDIDQIEGEHCAGFDCGRTHDKSAFVDGIRDKMTGIFYVINTEVWDQMEFDLQFQKLCDRMDALNIRKLCMDASGIGAMLGENMRKRYGGRVEAVQFTAQFKTELWGDLKRDLGTGKTLLPPNNSRLATELHNIQRVITASSNIVFQAPHDALGHCDLATAAALANRASNRPRSSFMPFGL
jgi:phage FluMu gp28-like protein